MTIAIPSNAVTACQKCGECCKRYAISVLPHEVKAQAQFLKIEVPAFVAIYTRLLVQIVPFQSGNHPLALHSSMVPRAVWEMLKKNGFDSEYAMILPMVGLKKHEYCVFFDPKSFGCTIHSVKPAQCSLFPFTSMNENANYAKMYDFCELSKITSPTNFTNVQIDIQRERMKRYFDSVAEKGLENVWTVLPAKGDIVFNGKSLGEISLTELKDWLSWSGKKEEKATSSKSPRNKK